MALIVQGAVALGQQGVAYPALAGDVSENKYQMAVPITGIVTGDILEIGILPANNVIIDAYIWSDALGTAVKFDVGIMSGDVGSKDTARTCGNEIFALFDAAAASTIITRMTKPAAPLLAATAVERSIGAKFNPISSGPTAGNLYLVVLTAAQG
jgi:hypothetical protein